MKLRKVCSLALALAMSLSLCVPVLADMPDASDSMTVTRSGGQGSVPVQLTTIGGGNPGGGDSGDEGDGGLAFKVKLPTALPAVVEADNTVHTATNAQIENLSAGPVAVTALKLSAANGWSIADYGADLSSRPIGEKSISLRINGLKSEANTANHVTYDRDAFMGEIREKAGTSYLWAANFNKGIPTPSRYGTMGIDYDIDIVPQNRSMNAETAVLAVLTVAFVYA